MANPWDNDPIVGRVGQGTILGSPNQKYPLEVQGEGLRNQKTAADIANEAQRLGMERERLRLAREAAAREAQAFNATHDPRTGAPIDPKATLATLRNNTNNLLLGSGINLEKGIDPVAPLIEDSTSGHYQHKAAELYGNITGQATPGMENIQRLQTIANDMVLQMTGGSLGNQISNSDRDFIAARLGDIGNPELPANQRGAAWDQVKQRFSNIMGVPYNPGGKGSGIGGMAGAMMSVSGAPKQSRAPSRNDSGWWGEAPRKQVSGNRVINFNDLP